MASYELASVASANLSLLHRPGFGCEVISPLLFLDLIYQDRDARYWFGLDNPTKTPPAIPAIKGWEYRGMRYRLADLTTVRKVDPERFRYIFRGEEGQNRRTYYAHCLMTGAQDVKLSNIKADLVTIGAAESHRFPFGQQMDSGVRRCLEPIAVALGLLEVLVLSPPAIETSYLVVGGLATLGLAVSRLVLKDPGVVLIAGAPIMRQSGQVLY